MSEPIQILSLGAGVQSSTLALMAAKGLVTPMPTAAIFADTQWEPPSVYRWLGWLTPKLPFPTIVATSGNLAETSAQIRTSQKTGEQYISPMIPAFTLNPDGSKGMWRRQCTDKAKLRVIRKEINRITQGQNCFLWIGITTDEAHRMKDSSSDRIVNRYPLAWEKMMSRHDCLVWMKKNGYPEPPRSACEACPLHHDREWIRLKRDEPEAFQRAIAYERKLQKQAAKVSGLTGTPFLHNSRIPLGEVQFDVSRGVDMFGNECEGMCGV